MLLHCTKEQIELMAKVDREEMEAMDCYIGVRGEQTTLQSCLMFPRKIWLSMTRCYGTPVHHEVRVAKTRWVVLRYPNDAMAHVIRHQYGSL